MKRHELEHILRAAGSITNLTEFVVIGSQAVLGLLPDAPESLLVSVEADLFPRHKPELSDLIDGTIGELSPFHQTFGYYGHGVGPKTAILPESWESRLVPLKNENTQGVTGWCLHPLDIAFSKLVAGRPKDLDYVRELFRHNLVDSEELNSEIESCQESLRPLLLSRFKIATRLPQSP